MAIDGISFEALAFAAVGIVATIIGVLMTYSLVGIRERRKAGQEFRNCVAIMYQEIKDNMLSLNAGTHIGLMKVNTSGLELLK